MSPLLRRWRGILATLIILTLGAEGLMLISNETPVRFKPVRIEHDDSSFVPWLVLRVENPHLSPIRLSGLDSDEPIPLGDHRIMSRDRGDGSLEEIPTVGGCTSSPSIIILPFSSREVRIPQPENLKGKTYNGIFETSLWSMNTSLLSWLGLHEEAREITASYDPRTELPVTGDPHARAAAEKASHHSCCGSEARKVATPRVEPALP